MNYVHLPYRYNLTLKDAPWETALNSLFPPPHPGGFFIDGNPAARESPLGGLNATAPLDSFVFGTQSRTRIYITTCGVNINYVDVNVSCVQAAGSSVHRSCAPTRIRRSTNVTAWSSGPFLREFLQAWPTILSDKQDPNTSTQTERFIADPAAFFKDNFRVGDFVEMGAMPIDIFAKRFGLLFNTLWKASVNPTFITGGKPKETAGPLISTTAHWDGSWSESGPMPDTYVLDKPWLAIFLASILVMLLAATSSLLLRLRPHVPAPEILGHFSSLTRDSPYMNMAASTGSTLDGIERARLLRDRRVRLVDVNGEGDVGRVALVEEGARTVHELQHGRLYV